MTERSPGRSVAAIRGADHDTLLTMHADQVAAKILDFASHR
jgi:hypothetical protein